jgi:receptor protein-tyrosine kinase
MNIIERAGKRLGLTPGKSLVEKAAERLAHDGLGGGLSGAGGLHPPAPQPSPKPSPKSGSTIGAAAPLAKAETGHAESLVEKAEKGLGEKSLGAPRAAALKKRETRRQSTIDFARLKEKGFALPVDQTALAEELRLIKRPLLASAFARGIQEVENSNLIMVTSANPNEGKTFIATNLALSMASEHDVHVLLIDADVANPSIPTVLGFEAEEGLVDAVSDPSIDLADVMIRTNIENLVVLPSGRPRPGASELLASARMTRFVNDIAKRYADRVIIFDSPPMLARSEAMVLAQHVGQVVFVVEAERTSRTAVNEALAMIGQKLGGVVLNKTPQIPLQEGFGYYDYRNR